MVEQERILEIGKHKFDVSNVSIKRKRIAVRRWNNLFNIKVDSDGEAILDNKGNPVERDKDRKRTKKQADRGILRIGLYLVCQDLEVLNRRYTRKESFKEMFRRKRISIRYLESLSTPEMNVFVEWIYETVTGVKKKVVNLVEPIIQELEKLTELMTEKELLDLTRYCTTSFLEQVGHYQRSIANLKKK